MTPSIDELARRLDRAQERGEALEQHGDGLSLAQAYAVQAAIKQLRIERGETFLGPKLGFTSRAKMAQMGVDEVIVGFLTDRMQLAPGSTLSLAGLVHPRVEPELVFRLAHDVVAEPGEDAVSLGRRLEDATDAVAAGLEVIDSRYRNFRFSLPDVVADNTSACRFVVGDWQPYPRPMSGLAVSMLVDGHQVSAGSSDAILGDPRQVFTALAAVALQHDIPLPAGAPVLAGAMTEAVALQPGQQASVQLEGFAEVGLSTR
ncbi:2-keto-4-pentenoate hydratase [Luteococcus sp. OSA5]|uniref:2-keto-4-pentenoate hydratase n=1 Tax=Luteococcus sp. OSA5 TaxID=3401630 RepID=UPI003B4308A9